MKREAPDMKDNTLKSGKSTEIEDDSAGKKVLEDTKVDVTELQEGTPAKNRKYKISGWNNFISENKAKVFR